MASPTLLDSPFLLLGLIFIALDMACSGWQVNLKRESEVVSGKKHRFFLKYSSPQST